MNELGVALIVEAKRRMFDESQARVNRCLGRLGEDQVWYRPNGSSNSVGNLVLHLCGNVRQWVIAGLGGAADGRERDAEFAEKGPIPVEALRQMFNETLDEAADVLDGLDPDSLLAKRPVQCYEETGLSIIVHVTEHLSYHTGQITYITKMLTDAHTGYYEDQDLGKTTD